jgi:non-specific serine/threonine protein kinase/serine/threonine-protein kinase
MSLPPSCPRCGAARSPREASRGVCPRCLLSLGFGEPGEAASAVDPLDAIGRRIGPYEILDLLGEGGMGVVYLAEQSEPIQRRIALKLIKLGMDTRAVIARFESERQALARMDHPDIARIHDAGVSPEGRPYFVMEYVPGLPITGYCDRERLEVRSRLRLFLRVCRAIQHAHHKGIIHRDVKPSNVLVQEVDGQPVVKVIDFGVAKAIDRPLAQHTLFTEQGVLLGTPEYMSPEQAALDGLAVDTRTDVYALGLLLYELLVGAHPFGVDDPRRVGLDEIRRRIREDEPPRPSARLASGAIRVDEILRARRTELAPLRRALRGDLDWIVMKALEKDVDRRYPSPSDLAADLERHLAHEPVAAGPPGALYRARKFLRRHRLGTAFAASVLVLLAAFGVSRGIQARRIVRERDRANLEAEASERVSRFLIDLFEVSDPGQARGETITAREILDQGAGRIERELADQPELQARLMATMGVVYKKLGLHDRSAPLLQKSREIRSAVLGEEHPDTIRSLLEIAELRFQEGRLQEAETTLREARETSVRALGEEHPHALAALGDLAVALHFQGRLDEAETLYRDALERRARVLGEGHPETLETMNNLAALLVGRGDLAMAETYLRRALAGRRAAMGADHPDVLDTTMNLGVVLQALGRLDEAEPVCREAVDLGRRIRPDHPKTLVSINNLGKLLERQGKLDEAARYYQEALEAFRRVVGDDHADTLSAMGNLADLYTTQGRLQEAEPLLAAAVRGVRRTLPREHVVTGYTLRKQGRFLTAAGRHAEAESALREAVEILTAAGGADHPQTVRAREDLARLHEARGVD